MVVNMKTKLLGLVAWVTLLGVSQAAATVFEIDTAFPGMGEFGPVAVSGTITTNGETSSPLVNSDILGYSLTVTDENSPSIYTTISYAGVFNALTGGINGSALTETSRFLIYNFSNPTADFALYNDAGGTAPPNGVVGFEPSEAYANLYFNPSPGEDDGQETPLSGDLIIGVSETYLESLHRGLLGCSTNECGYFLTPAPTPLPAAFPLFATGLGALSLLGWRRKRKPQASA